jgi:hypothetical protein
MWRALHVRNLIAFFATSPFYTLHKIVHVGLMPFDVRVATKPGPEHSVAHQ